MRLRLRRSAADASAYAIDPARYEGTYWSAASGLMRRLEARDGRLTYVRPGGGASELSASGPDRFRMLGVPVATDVIFEAGPPRRLRVTAAAGARPWAGPRG